MIKFRSILAIVLPPAMAGSNHIHYGFFGIIVNIDPGGWYRLQVGRITKGKSLIPQDIHRTIQIIGCPFPVFQIQCDEPASRSPGINSQTIWHISLKDRHIISQIDGVTTSHAIRGNIADDPNPLSVGRQHFQTGPPVPVVTASGNIRAGNEKMSGQLIIPSGKLRQVHSVTCHLPRIGKIDQNMVQTADRSRIDVLTYRNNIILTSRIPVRSRNGYMNGMYPVRIRCPVDNRRMVLNEYILCFSIYRNIKTGDLQLVPVINRSPEPQRIACQ